MKFTATAKFGDHLAALTWEDGELTGPRVVVDYVKEVAEGLTGARLGHPEGLWTTHDYLDQWYSTLDLLARALGPDVVVENAPAIEPPAEGAVG